MNQPCVYMWRKTNETTDQPTHDKTTAVNGNKHEIRVHTDELYCPKLVVVEISRIGYEDNIAFSMASFH